MYRVLALGLHLAKELVGANIPEHVLERAQVTPEIESMASQMREWLFRDSKSSLSLFTVSLPSGNDRVFS